MTPKPGAPKIAASPLKVIETKWTKPLIEAGWAAIPNVIIEHQKALGLDPLDLSIILQLIVCWWSPDRPPFPGKERIAANIGVSPRTVQRRLVRLSRVGMISKDARFTTRGRQRSNVYGFKGLIAKATPHAQRAVAMKKARTPAPKRTA